MLTRIYLDANAGAPLLPEVRDAMVAALGDGREPVLGPRRGPAGARDLVETARAEVARGGRRAGRRT